MTRDEKTLVLGFDALDFNYLDAFRAELPNFSDLRTSGAEAPLNSTHPPWTGSAWPSMYTGTSPGKHDAHGFFSYDGYPDDASLVTRTDVQAPALWNYLTERDVPSVVLNVPVTHPADPIEGVLVPGYLAPDEEPGFPAGIRDELSDAIDSRYRIYSRAETGSGERKLNGYVDLIRMRARAATYLLSEFDWQLAVLQVQKTDAVFHNFETESAFRRIYRTADDFVGTVLDAVDEPNVIVCSDHGIGPVDGYKIFINEVLREHGYLETTDERRGPSLADRKSDLTGNGTEEEYEPTRFEQYLSGVVKTLSDTALSPGNVYAAASRIGADSLLRDVLPESVISAASRGINWSNSRAYCRNGSEMGVRLNLAGREPDGIVPEGKYEQTRTELISLLSSLETPDGDPVFEFAERYEDVCAGPVTDNACDIVFRPAGMNHTIHTSLVGRQFIPADVFDHKTSGVFLASGPAFDSQASLSALSLTDVAPTVMASLGQPVPERLTGSVPEPLLERSITRADYGDVPYGTESEPSHDDSGVEDRLEDLGYL